MKIIPMTHSHISEAVNIEKLCFPDPWPASFFISELNNPGCIYIAAEDDYACNRGILMGYAGMQYVLDEGYINNVAVSPSFQRRGVASRLLEELFIKARSLSLVFLTLEVRSGNDSAIALYSRHGFETVGRRRNYYEHPCEDAVLMTKYFT